MEPNNQIRAYKSLSDKFYYLTLLLKDKLLKQNPPIFFFQYCSEFLEYAVYLYLSEKKVISVTGRKKEKTHFKHEV